MVLIDMHFYGKLVIAPLNIVLYNVISGHGPELYGNCLTLICGFIVLCCGMFIWGSPRS